MQLIKIHTTGSTNDDLRTLIRQTDVAPFTCIWALHQTNGKGQMGNTWKSETSKNLTFSILIKDIALNISNQFTLNKVVALTLKEVLSEYYSNIQIKWANDILADNQKIAGILIENSLKGNYISNVIVGIGININQTHFENLNNATSLKLITNKDFDLESILLKILNLIELKFSEINNWDENLIHTEYLNNLFGYKENREFETFDNIQFQGKIIDVNTAGKLQIQTHDQHIHEFGLKEIKFLF